MCSVGCAGSVWAGGAKQFTGSRRAACTEEWLGSGQCSAAVPWQCASCRAGSRQSAQHGHRAGSGRLALQCLGSGESTGGHCTERTCHVPAVTQFLAASRRLLRLLAQSSVRSWAGSEGSPRCGQQGMEWGGCGRHRALCWCQVDLCGGPCGHPAGQRCLCVLLSSGGTRGLCEKQPGVGTWAGSCVPTGVLRGVL